MFFLFENKTYFAKQEKQNKKQQQQQQQQMGTLETFQL